MLRELAEGVYLEDGYRGGNVGAIMTARGAVLVDAPMLPPEARTWRATLKELGIQRLYGVIATDYHPEHLIGSAAFMPTRLFGHEYSAKPIAKYRTTGLEQLATTYRESNPALADEIVRIEIHEPEIMVGDRLTLYLGERTLEVLHLEGHTPASLGVYLPRERILFAGDNVTCGDHPTMYQCNSLAWLETLVRIQELEVDVIVPGIGPVCGKEVVEPLYDYINELRQRIEEMYDRGASRRECVEKIDMLSWFPVPDESLARVKRRCRENVEQVYTEIRTNARKRRQKSRTPGGPAGG
ncbi:MAG: MBL fold metallo-hydrolase [Chloroflexota bacterium]